MLLRSCLLLLCLPRAAAVCPAGWSESPAGGCYRLTDERATQWECDELCGAEASLACISSEEESTYISMELLRAGRAAWIGLYQTPGAAEPDGGWSHCSNGEAVNFTNWFDGEPNEYGVEDCAAMRGEWSCSRKSVGLNSTM